MSPPRIAPPPELEGRKWPDLTATEQRALVDALITLVVAMGAKLSTAYRVAALFVQGLDEGRP